MWHHKTCPHCHDDSARVSWLDEGADDHREYRCENPTCEVRAYDVQVVSLPPASGAVGYCVTERGTNYPTQGRRYFRDAEGGVRRASTPVVRAIEVALSAQRRAKLAANGGES